MWRSWGRLPIPQRLLLVLEIETLHWSFVSEEPKGIIRLGSDDRRTQSQKRNRSRAARRWGSLLAESRREQLQVKGIEEGDSHSWQTPPQGHRQSSQSGGLCRDKDTARLNVMRGRRPRQAREVSGWSWAPCCASQTGAK